MDFQTGMYTALIIFGIFMCGYIIFLWKVTMDFGRAHINYHAWLYEQSLRKNNKD